MQSSLKNQILKALDKLTEESQNKILECINELEMNIKANPINNLSKYLGSIKAF